MKQYEEVHLWLMICVWVVYICIVDVGGKNVDIGLETSIHLIRPSLSPLKNFYRNMINGREDSK